jgi:tRNA(Arg) A34 adenosine deaminase TadA
MKRMFRLAERIAIKKNDIRRYCIGAVGLRADGTIVKSTNLPCRYPEPQAHAEARLCRKLDKGSIVYVVRVLKNGDYANATPCRTCRSFMQMVGVRRCYYTITNSEYGVIDFKG